MGHVVLWRGGDVTWVYLVGGGNLCKRNRLGQFFSAAGPRPGTPGPGINYTGPRESLLELITNLNVILYLSTCHTVYIIVLILFMIMP